MYSDEQERSRIMGYVLGGIAAGVLVLSSLSTYHFLLKFSIKLENLKNKISCV